MTTDVTLDSIPARKTFLFRLWAVFFCVIAFMYAWLAEGLAGWMASGLSSGPWFELVYRSTLLCYCWWATGRWATSFSGSERR